MGNTSVSPQQLSGKLNLLALIALVVGSMIGGGIFSLPQNMAAHAGAGAIIIAWIITCFGMLTLAFVFQNLANRKPEITGGVYGYARAGFGDFVGFCSAWGYWVSSVIANVSFFVVLFSALSTFPVLSFFGNGNTWQAIAASSVLLWAIHVLVLRGTKSAALTNTITTIAKIVPIVIFIVLLVSAFNLKMFSQHFWGTSQLGSPLDQVRSSMLVTVWVFIGIEGASMFSSRAFNPKHVGKATVLGFLITTVLLVCVSLLALGILSQPALAELKNPSMAGVLAQVVGPWGAVMINLGLLVSVGGALLAWTMIAAEVPFLAAQDGIFPACFARRNSAETPVVSLWITNGTVQLFLLLTMVYSAGYLSILLLATSMVLVPYFLCGLYAWKIAYQGDGYGGNDAHRAQESLIGALASLYGAWLLYAAGPKYLLLSAILYSPGVLIFYWAKREGQQPLFNGQERRLALLVLSLAAVSWVCLVQGIIQLN